MSSGGKSVSSPICLLRVWLIMHGISCCFSWYSGAEKYYWGSLVYHDKNYRHHFCCFFRSEAEEKVEIQTPGVTGRSLYVS